MPGLTFHEVGGAGPPSRDRFSSAFPYGSRFLPSHRVPCFVQHQPAFAATMSRSERFVVVGTVQHYRFFVPPPPFQIDPVIHPLSSPVRLTTNWSIPPLPSRPSLSITVPNPFLCYSLSLLLCFLVRPARAAGSGFLSAPGPACSD